MRFYLSALLLFHSLAFADADTCANAMLKRSVTTEEAQFFIKMNGLRYGVSFFHKEIEGRDRLLILINEHPFKRKRAQELADEFRERNIRPVLSDSEKLPGMPAAEWHTRLRTWNERVNPFYFFWPFNIRQESLTEGMPAAADVEIGWTPSLTAKAGYGMNLSTNAARFLMTLAAYAGALDALSGAALGPHYTLGLMQMTTHVEELVQNLNPLHLLRGETLKHSPWLAVVLPMGINLLVSRLKGLRKLLPPFAFKSERADLVLANIDQYWAQNPEQDQAVLSVTHFSNHYLRNRLLNEGGYNEILKDQLFEIAQAEQPRTLLFRLTQYGRNLTQRLKRLQDRFLPPDLE